MSAHVTITDKLRSGTNAPLASESKQRYEQEHLFDNDRDIPDVGSVAAQIFNAIDGIDLTPYLPKSAGLTQALTNDLYFGNNYARNIRGLYANDGIPYIVGDRFLVDQYAQGFVDFRSSANGLGLKTNGAHWGYFKTDNLTVGSKVFQFQDKNYTIAGLDDIYNWNAGLHFKQDVRLATTGDISISSPPSIIDSVEVLDGDRILLLNQLDKTQNGIYIFNGLGLALTRSEDADTGEELANKTVPVNEGLIYADKWFTITNDVITIGVTEIVFTQTSASTYTAGAGLSLSGVQFSVDGTVMRANGSVVVTDDHDWGGHAITQISNLYNENNDGDYTTIDVDPAGSDVIVKVAQTGGGNYTKAFLNLDPYTKTFGLGTQDYDGSFSNAAAWAFDPTGFIFQGGNKIFAYRIDEGISFENSGSGAINFNIEELTNGYTVKYPSKSSGDYVPVFTDDIEELIEDKTYTFKRSLSSAQILSLGTNNVPLGLPLPGAGMAWQVVSCMYNVSSGTNNYSAVSIQIRSDGGNYQIVALPLATIGVSAYLSISQSVSVATQWAQNTDLIFYASTNPTGGDKSIDFYLTLKKVTV